jgi:hypothetical protein
MRSDDQRRRDIRQVDKRRGGMRLHAVYGVGEQRDLGLDDLRCKFS